MMAILRDKRGATSVLVIFMMIVLVVFATLAFTTSYANYKLSQKSSAITSGNFALEDLAMSMVMKVDSCLANAELRAQEYMRGKPFDGNIDDLTLAQSEFIRQAAQNSPADKFLPSIMNRVYYHFALQELAPLLEENKGIKLVLGGMYEDGDFFDMNRPLPEPRDVSLSIALTTGDNAGDKQLDVILLVHGLKYDLSTPDGVKAEGSRTEGFIKRYEIEAWKQWQIPFTYDDSLEFGDARIDPPSE